MKAHSKEESDISLAIAQSQLEHTSGFSDNPQTVILWWKKTVKDTKCQRPVLLMHL
jgi:hypothetical protein